MNRRLLTVQIMLGALGVVGVATAAPGSAFEQFTRVLVALVITFLVARISEKTVVKLSPFVFVFLVAMLVLVFFKGESPGGSESKRWLMIFGVSFQPSEFMKVSVIA